MHSGSVLLEIYISNSAPILKFLLKGDILICLISSGCINVMNDEPKRQQIIPGKYFLYSHNILQIRYHVFPFSLISNCHPHYSLSKILTNKLIYILYIVSYSYSIFCIQFIHIIFTHNIHIYI